MKKWMALVLAVCVSLSLAACGAPGETTDAVFIEPADSVELLSNIWDAYGSEEKFYAIGGDVKEDGTLIERAPGSYSLTNTDGLTTQLMVPAERLAEVTDAASLIHGMNQNLFTCGAFRISGDSESFADAIGDRVLGNQWICGFPEKLVVARIGENYVVCAFGNGEIMDVFRGHLKSVYPNAALVHDETIGG